MRPSRQASSPLPLPLRLRLPLRLPLLLPFVLLACGNGPDTIRERGDLPKLAERFRVELQQAGIKPVCSMPGLKEVEFYLDKMPEGVQQAHVPLVGAYLGECMLGTYGGEWVEDQPGAWAVKFSEGNMAFPLSSVQDYVDDPDAGDSFAAVFDALPRVFGWEEKEEGPRDWP